MPKKDYKKRNLKNPFFRQKKNKKNKKKILLSLIVLAFLSLLFYILFYSPLFSIKNITIEGTERTADYLIEDLVWQETQNRHIFDIKGDNLWFFSKDKLKEEIYQRLDLANISVNKRIPNTLRINVEERKASFILKFQDQHQFRDLSGCPITSLEVNEDDLKNYPILEKNLFEEKDLNRCLNLNAEYMLDVVDLYYKSDQFENFSISKFIINGEVFNINLVLNEGPRVFFSRREDFLRQFQKLEVICEEVKENNNLENIEYIDVRYGNKAYINYK